MLKKIGLALFAIFVIIQFFRIDKTNPEVIAENDFLYAVGASDDVAQIIKTSCYDCHSNTSKYPWYSNVAPVSWWLKDHINEAREELNFSEWETYNITKKANILEEAIEEVEEGEMPLSSYTLTHGDAKLNPEQIKLLIHFFETLKSEYEQEAQNYLNEESTEIQEEDESIGELTLNNGKKWVANAETIEGVKKMTAILAEPVEEERVILYVARGQLLMKEFDLLVAKCNMTGEAHEQLHHYILPLKEKIELLMNCEDTTTCDLTSLDILRFLNKFNNYFEGEENS